MEEVSEDTGKWLVVYDLDQTLTTQHTGGDKTRKWFESPRWRNNIRCLDEQRQGYDAAGGSDWGELLPLHQSV